MEFLLMIIGGAAWLITMYLDDKKKKSAKLPNNQLSNRHLFVRLLRQNVVVLIVVNHVKNRHLLLLKR